jgi:nucleoside-diphosphate-sugar epimerase
MAESRTVLVLGATGFLGRHACAALSAGGWLVVPVSRHGTVARDLVGSSTDELRALVREWRPEAVVNAVGLLWGRDLDPLALRATNAEFPARLAEVLRGTRLVHLGSVYEYGDQPPGSVIDERTAEHPATPYARSKLAGSLAVRAAGGTVLRVTTAIGAGAPRDSFLGGLAVRLADGMRGSLQVPLAPGARDFVHAGDVADAVVCAVRALRTGLYIVGGGRPVAPRQLVESLIRASGAPVTLTALPARDGVRGGVENQMISVTEALIGLGWRPRRSLDDAVRDLWKDLS